ncbi:thiolase C-terminal domain-containing protein [Paraburkholderia sp.]|uniref:thiolase C-terminal domain-containing protein n=1 Tax=Paraburkholderia sp. TaxID=1926495 RepID=UPI002D2DFEB5|nr:acetyl-CoA acetyltransferase [Paraburkholderia sp.]HZZ02315.1 acetyl-CoA acetyltransferase [Paraburkholderia sp.]
MSFPTADAPKRLQPCIVGVGETAYAKRGGHNDQSEFELCLQAIRNAAADAGIEASRIDGYASFGFERHEPVMVQAALAAPLLRFSSLVWGGGGGGCSASVMLAAAAVATGQCQYAVAYRSICQGQYERYGEYRARPMWGSYVAPFGLMSPAMMMALVYRRYLEESGMNADHLAELAVTIRGNAQKNPRAVMHGRSMTHDDYFAARMVADPFRLYDCCLETDGACAVLITSAELAEKLQRPAVPILAAAQASGARWTLGPMGSHNMPLDTYATINSRDVAAALYQQSGLTPGDIDVAQFYDAFTGLIPMALEDYGFCRRGDTGAFIEAGEIRAGGRLPVNTSGGLLSEAYLHGLNLVIEGVRQMRGESTAQVDGARHCLITSGGGGGHKSGLILGRP